MSNSKMNVSNNPGFKTGHKLTKNYYRIATALILTGSLLLGSNYSYGQSDNPVLDTATLPTLEKLAQDNPDSLSYQMAYIDAFRKNTPGANWNNQDSIVRLIIPQYKKWMAAHPKSAVLPLAIGQSFANGESPEAKPYLLKAVSINPKQAEAWSTLSIDAERWGDNKGAMEYMRKAAEAAPEEPSYSFYYAMDFENIDRKMWEQKIYALAKKYPENERGAQGLYWLANRTPDRAKKIAIYEQLRTLYPPQKYGWSESGMQDLFTLYLETDPAKAKAISSKLLDKRGWPKLDSIANSFIEANTLITQGKPEQAMTVIDSVKLPYYPDMASLKVMLYAKAAAKAGHTDSSYSKLTRLYAEAPTSALMATIETYGKELGRDKTRIQKDISSIRSSTAEAAPDFDLGLYTSDGNAKLADFKGKVVLLTFWFPGCGPCRGEFPHFQNVINKFKGQPVSYVGINVNPGQDPYVLPFMKGTGYTFIPLRADSDWAWEHYKVRGEPTNFLIDQNGQIIYSNFRIDGNNEHTLELMIKELLAQS